jgi:hypothetical protein
MHLIESYSLASGLKIKDPYIQKDFFPIPFEKYIVLHAGGGNGKFPSKNYSYFSEVCELLRMVIPEDVKIIQIGGSGEPAIKNCEYLCGKTTFQQTAYILSNALLFFGNDSMNGHIASYFDIPMVVLYGPTTKENHGPYFGKKENQICLVSHRDEKLPSYSSNENPATINYIKPEDVANNILSLMNYEIGVKRKSLFFGEKYGIPVIEFVPDMILSEKYNADVVTCRMDYHWDEGNLARNLANRKINIVTDRQIEVGILKKFVDNVVYVNFEVKLPSDSVYCKSLIKAIGKVNLFSYESDEQKQKDIKFAFMDIGKIHFISKKTRADVEKSLEGVDLSKVKYRTSKFFISCDKVYTGYDSWLKDESISSLEENTQKISDSDEFWVDLDYYYLYV